MIRKCRRCALGKFFWPILIVFAVISFLSHMSLTQLGRDAAATGFTVIGHVAQPTRNISNIRDILHKLDPQEIKEAMLDLDDHDVLNILEKVDTNKLIGLNAMLLGNQRPHEEDKNQGGKNQSSSGEADEGGGWTGYALQNASEDKMMQYYESLGIKVTSYTHPQYFQALFAQQDKVMLSKMAKEMRTAGNNVFHPALDLQYPAFNVTLPRFVSKGDETTFFKCRTYMDLINEMNLPPKLQGHLEFIYEGSAKEKFDCGWKENLTKWRDYPSSYKTRYDGNHLVIPLLVPDSQAFQLFTNGVLPKLAQIYPLLSNPNIRYLIMNPRDKIILDMLTRVGIQSSQLYKYYKTKDTISLRYQLNVCKAPPIHPILWRQMRRMMRIPEHLSVPFTQASVILLTRAKAHNGGRNIKNDAEVRSLLKQRYRDRLVVFEGGYTLDQSIEMFGKARMIIGVHGGAFFNMNYSPQETVIIEYLAMTEKGDPKPKNVAHAVVWAMSNLLSQPYYRIIERPKSIKGDLEVTIEKLTAVLDEVDRLQGVEHKS